MRISVRRAFCSALLCYAPLVLAQSHFNACLAPTGTNASIIIPLSVAVTVSPTPSSLNPIEAGDEIAVFTPEGVCAGVVTWSEDGAALAAWGDDPQTEEQDGFLIGDTLTYRVWDISTEQELRASATAYDGLFDTTGRFSPDAVFLVAALHFGESPPVASEGGTPRTLFALNPNYPNPFMDRTTLSFSVARAERIRLEVYDLLGRRVATLVDEERAPGHHEVVFDARTLASGAYIARLIAGAQSATQRIQVVRRTR